MLTSSIYVPCLWLLLLLASTGIVSDAFLASFLSKPLPAMGWSTLFNPQVANYAGGYVSKLRNAKSYNTREQEVEGTSPFLDSDFQRLDRVESDIRSPRRQVLLGRFVAWVLHRVVRRNAESATEVKVKVFADSNYNIVAGQLDAIEMRFDKMAYANIYVSGGGHVIVKNLKLRMRRFLFRNQQSVRAPYTIYADALLTQEDIVNSTVIRSLIQMLVDTILERVLNVSGVVKARIQKVTIHSRRIHVKGVANVKNRRLFDNGLGLSGAVDFEVSTGAGVRPDGQFVFLRDIRVALNPDSSLRTILPILTTSPIDIDLGEDSMIKNLVIGKKNIWIRAASVVSPVQPFHVAELKSDATYRYDLSAFLSRLLQLNGGILRAAMRRRFEGSTAN